MLSTSWCALELKICQHLLSHVRTCFCMRGKERQGIHARGEEQVLVPLHDASCAGQVYDLQGT